MNDRKRRVQAIKRAVKANDVESVRRLVIDGSSLCRCHRPWKGQNGRTVLEEVLLNPFARSRRVAELLRERGAAG